MVVAVAVAAVLILLYHLPSIWTHLLMVFVCLHSILVQRMLIVRLLLQVQMTIMVACLRRNPQ